MNFSQPSQLNESVALDCLFFNASSLPHQNLITGYNNEKSNLFNNTLNYDLDQSKMSQCLNQQYLFSPLKAQVCQKEYSNFKKADLNYNYQLLNALKKGKNLAVGDIISIISDIQNYQQPKYFKAYNSEQIIESSKDSFEKESNDEDNNAQNSQSDLQFKIVSNVLKINMKDEKNNMVQVYFRVYYCNELENKQTTFQSHQQNQNKEQIYIIMEITESSYLPSNLIDVKQFDYFKKKILSSVSHELQTPLNCSIQLLEILQNSDILQETQKKMFVTPTLNSNQLLMYMINDIIDFAQIADGELKLNFTHFNIVDTIRDCLSYFTIQAAFKNITIDFNFDQEIPLIIHSDPMRLKQVVINLISNAIKFTNKGFISVNLDLEDENLIKISIQDTGCGIPSQLGSNIFKGVEDYKNIQQKFNTKGAGLGLTIANNIAMGLGDNRKIEYTSQVDVGSVFTFFVLNRSKNISGCKINHVNIFNRSYYQWISLKKLSMDYVSRKSLENQESSLRSKYSFRYSYNQSFKNTSQREFQTLSIEAINQIENLKSQNFAKKQNISALQILTPENRNQQCESQSALWKEPEKQYEEEYNSSISSQSIQNINLNKKRDTIDTGFNSYQTIKLQSKNSYQVSEQEDKQPSIQSQMKQQHLQANHEDEPCNIPSDNSIQYKTHKRINYNYFNVAHRKNIKQISTRGQDYIDIDKNQYMIPKRIRDSQLDILQSEILKVISDSSLSVLSPKKIPKKNNDQRHKRLSIQSTSQRIFSQDSALDRRFSLSQEDLNKKTIKKNYYQTDLSPTNQNKIFKHAKKMSTISEETITNYTKKLMQETQNNGVDSDYNKSNYIYNNSVTDIKNCQCPKILIVDDNPFNLFALELRLKEYSYEVDKANSGMEAIEKVKNRYNNQKSCCKQYKLIFMDIDMPQKNGYETTLEIFDFFNSINEKCCPISACTAYVQEEEKKKAFNTGMSYYLTKPVLSEKLLKILISANL
ncbi:response regulator receiver domain protein (macronuclear) [Tetrahymena thermophila SB210]|uniref:Response regulator receiver domain protein n=1 Tax=Tetrahymena thermophila (strain SB210) TaxID=312017 RepID=I7MGA9_TETTS|nr:response regulator receiver domain protein [Tetrahymena thermophila SB210]EAR84981.2 response regulator receiver domain protein [Tetrahymena thermophila SB210]|eukprot:XP_001032644.2 response regulator receiver domain protein [Tetrahymena thermophila SB210]